VQPDGSILVSYKRSLLTKDLSLTLQFSDNLSTWSSAGIAPVSRTINNGTSTDELTLSVPPPPAGTSHRFIRLVTTLW
jgi:hypothetical protein